MWDNLTPADVEHARNNLSMRRTTILHRHTQELNALDNEAAEIETFVRVAEAFAQRYKNQPTPPSSEAGSETAATSAPDTNADVSRSQTDLKVQYSPNFADLIRRRGPDERDRHSAKG